VGYNVIDRNIACHSTQGMAFSASFVIGKFLEWSLRAIIESKVNTFVIAFRIQQHSISQIDASDE
jgi:hypothetical protein